jgi:single-strand DNA-binding protein
MNTVSIIGRLGHNPETRSTTGGRQVTTFSVAVDNRFRDDNEPDWVNVEAWGKLAEVVAGHKSKGDQVAITGRLTSSNWTDADGTNRTRLYVTAETIDFLHNAKTDNEEAA